MVLQTVITPERSDTDLIDSASITALMRALLSSSEGLERNPDYLAPAFLHGSWKAALTDIEKTITYYSEKFPGGMYYHLIRTKAFDDMLLRYIANHSYSQVVILGAGYDSRAIRFHKQLNMANVMVFEVDLYGMQKHKQNLIKNAGLDDSSVIYAPCNFQKDDLIKSLFESGLELHRDVLVLWEGVTYFLTPTQIDQSLSDISKLSERNVDLFFDYAFSDYVDGTREFFGSKELKNILNEINEPHHFGLNPADIEPFFSARGYTTIFNVTSLMLESWYLRDEFGRSVGLPHSFNGFAHVRTTIGR